MPHFRCVSIHLTDNSVETNFQQSRFENYPGLFLFTDLGHQSGPCEGAKSVMWSSHSKMTWLRMNQHPPAPSQGWRTRLCLCHCRSLPLAPPISKNPCLAGLLNSAMDIQSKENTASFPNPSHSDDRGWHPGCDTSYRASGRRCWGCARSLMLSTTWGDEPLRQQYPSGDRTIL